MTRIVSAYTNCYGPAGVWTAAARIGETGIGHLELALKGHDFGGLVIAESAVVTERADDVTAAQFRDYLADHGVTASGCNVGGADIKTTEGALLTERRIRFAARWFGVKVCVGGAGQPADAHERRQVVANLRRLGDFAAGCGVTLTLETHKGPTQNASAMLQLMGEVDHPHVRLNFDTGNIGYYNGALDICEELKRVGHLVGSVHLKDSRGGFEDWYFPALGEGGAVDFTGVRRVLDGGLCWPLYNRNRGDRGRARARPRGAAPANRRSVAHLRACGYFD